MAMGFFNGQGLLVGGCFDGVKTGVSVDHGRRSCGLSIWVVKIGYTHYTLLRVYCLCNLSNGWIGTRYQTDCLLREMQMNQFESD